MQQDQSISHKPHMDTVNQILQNVNMSQLPQTQSNPQQPQLFYIVGNPSLEHLKQLAQPAQNSSSQAAIETSHDQFIGMQTQIKDLQTEHNRLVKEYEDEIGRLREQKDKIFEEVANIQNQDLISSIVDIQASIKDIKTKIQMKPDYNPIVGSAKNYASVRGQNQLHKTFISEGNLQRNETQKYYSGNHDQATEPEQNRKQINNYLSQNTETENRKFGPKSHIIVEFSNQDEFTRRDQYSSNPQN